ncbi:MAG TPA: hypothetical protein VN253_04435 [Kofleriaceae bacterium]|nr:hypothetical protein [Kofleriaceae bacterium]
MINLGDFKGTFGDPEPSTGVPLVALHLEQQPFLEKFEREIGNGVFLHGAFSVASVREQGLDLEPWMHLLPAGSRHFATNSIGELFFVAPDQKLYFLMIHSGEATELQTSPDEFFAWLTRPRNEGLYAALGQFHAEPRRLRPKQILTYEPPVALGGAEEPDALVAIEASDALARLAGIHFDNEK